MNRPIVIVDPLSSGVELASTFIKRGTPCIAVTFAPLERMGFGTQVKKTDFIDIIPNQPGLEDILRKYNPIAIIPGTESGVELAERLTKELTPVFSNDPEKSIHRQHKAFMQKALIEADVPAIKTLDTSSEIEVEKWIKDNELGAKPLIVKPPISAGSDKVFHIPAEGDWKVAFNRVLTEASKITGEISKTAVVQEQAIGTEYAVGTVSCNGEHYLSHIIKYNKSSSGERETVFDHVEFLPFDEKNFGELFDYTKMALDALGIRWGAAHNEVKVTKDGPRLIETGARMLGGPTVGFSREASGSSQADKLAEVYLDRAVKFKHYDFLKTVMPVFIRAKKSGSIINAEIFDEVKSLSTLFESHIWFKNGDIVKKTEDYLTSIGIVALSGERDSVYRDYEVIREIESRLEIR